MKKIIYFLVVTLSLLFVAHPLWAAEQYGKLTDSEVYGSLKGQFDDPAPFYKNIDWYKKVIPPDIYDQLVFDEEEMRKLWAEAIGFKAPDVVGKLYTEIKPGKYNLNDKEKYPFKELMPPHYYERFNEPGAQGKNLAGNYTEFEVVPTRQYYYSTPVCKATIKNMGKTKQDDRGYILHETYIDGYPFPRPSGKHKAMQLVYNIRNHYHYFDSNVCVDRYMGINSRFRQDYDGINDFYTFKLRARLRHSPLGWFDEAAERMGEERLNLTAPMSPRDEYGNVYWALRYSDFKKESKLLIYYNLLRRIRKMSASDFQDQSVGSDQTYDDTDGFAQKISPDVYPYEYTIIDDREFLVPAPTVDGTPWMSSKEKYIMKDLKFERRPMWVLETKQLDQNYIYSKRIWYIDKETLDLWFIENYDQKGRLYRTYTTHWAFIPKMGLPTKFTDLMLDHIDVHSTYETIRSFPAYWMTRKEINVRSLLKMK